MVPTPSLEPLHTPLTRFAWIIGAAIEVASAQAGRDRRLSPLVVLLCRYLRRLGGRFDSVLARLAAGTLTARPPRPRSSQPRPAQPEAAQPEPSRPAPPAEPVPPPPPRFRLPRRVAWLTDLVPGTTAMGCHLRLLLHDPEMAALLQAAPQLGRLLRPLCRVLGITPGEDLPPGLFPPRRERVRPAPAAAKAPRTRTPRTKARLNPARLNPVWLKPRMRGGLPTHPSGRVPAANWPKGV